jgi:hypothetical protein
MGEVKRIFYVLEYLPPEELQAGAHTGNGDNYVRFSVEGSQKSRQAGRIGPEAVGIN